MSQVKPRLKTVSDTLAARKTALKKPGAAARAATPKKARPLPSSANKAAKPSASTDTSASKPHRIVKSDTLAAQGGAAHPSSEPQKADAPSSGSETDTASSNASPTSPRKAPEQAGESEIDSVEVIGQPQEN